MKQLDVTTTLKRGGETVLELSSIDTYTSFQMLEKSMTFKYGDRVYVEIRTGGKHYLYEVYEITIRGSIRFVSRRMLRDDDVK